MLYALRHDGMQTNIAVLAAMAPDVCAGAHGGGPPEGYRRAQNGALSGTLKVPGEGGFPGSRHNAEHMQSCTSPISVGESAQQYTGH